MNLTLTSGSLSTSSGSERDRWVRGTRVGHILDPHTGSPAPFRGSVSVWHESALVADVLSTALYVMGPRKGLSWAEARGIAAVFAMPRADGTLERRASTSFATRFAETRLTRRSR
jgi:thiamine biosynthesis lipoprotein